MAMNLYWRPINNGGELSNTLKYILKGEGHLYDKPLVLSNDDLSYLKGIKAGCGNADVKNEINFLIDAIGIDNKIELYLY